DLGEALRHRQYVRLMVPVEDLLPALRPQGRLAVGHRDDQPLRAKRLDERGQVRMPGGIGLGLDLVEADAVAFGRARHDDVEELGHAGPADEEAHRSAPDDDAVVMADSLQPEQPVTRLPNPRYIAFHDPQRPPELTD